MSLIVAIVATGMGLCATLMMVVLLLAAMPNGKPDDLARIRIVMICVLSVGALGTLGATIALVSGKPSIAAMIGFFPTIVVVGLFAWLVMAGG